MNNKLLHLVAAALLSGGTAMAGSFANNFTNPDNTTGFLVQGSGTLADSNPWQPVIASDGLYLTTNQNGLGASLVISDFDGMTLIESFTAKFQLLLNGGADGTAFAFGPDINDATGPFAEIGPGMGQGGFAISFDIYDNGAPDFIGISTYMMGAEYGKTPMALSDTAWKDVEIKLNRNGTLSMNFGGKAIYNNLLVPGYTHTYGQFAFGARTGGVNANQGVRNLSITTTLKGDDVAPSISKQPASVSINEKESATFEVGFDGTPPFTFQWSKNGTDIMDATSNFLTLTDVLAADNGAKIKCAVVNALGTVTTTEATLSVKSDVVAPTVVSAKGFVDVTHALVVFSKPVTAASAENAANYKIDNNLTVSAAVLNTNDFKSVVLTTSAQTAEITYTLTVNGVKDTTTAGNPVAANSKATFRSLVFVAGTVLHKKYNNITDGVGGPTGNLFLDPRYPNNPDRVDLAPMWEYPLAGAGRVAADPVRNYFDSIEGFFIAPATDDYAFLICGADRFWLYLSTDESPANMHLVASQPGGWTNPRNWITGQGGTDMTVTRTDGFAGTEWPEGNTVHLVKGKRYYMLSVHHDPSWCGADDFAATYKLASESDPVDGDAPRLTGSVVGSYLDPSGASVSFASQPASVTSIQGYAATFTASATGVSAYGTSVFLQWQSAPKGSSTWTPIAGATSETFKTPLLTLADNGTQYRLVATVPPVTVTSSVVTVTVTGDTTPPSVTVGAMQDATAGTVDIGVGFSETVDAEAGVASNYSISAGTIASVTVYTNRFTENSQNPLAKFLKQSVLLKVTGLTGSATLTVKNISDVFGNKLVSTNVPFTVNTKMSWGVVGANEFGGINEVVPVAPNGFDVYSDGVTEWGNYDETTFVSEQVTGDFDKKLRVEYQDGSSQWARAGLIVRDVKNFGVDRATQAGTTTAAPYDGQAGRYQKVHVSPVGAVLTGPGTAGNGLWECNRRLDTGGATTGPVSGVNATPQFPNVWCRLQRVGQKFSSYRSDDGKNWVLLTSTTWGVDDESKTPMPATLFVGPEYSPENGNVTQEADKGTFLAQFRDYGDYSAIVDAQLKVGMAAGKVTITWVAGTLVSSSTVNGIYAPVTGAASPYAVTPAAGTSMFYRIKQ